MASGVTYGHELPTGQAGELPVATRTPEERRRRRRLIVIFFLLGVLLLLMALAIWYFLFRQPINPLPVIPVTPVPAYSTSIYGVTRPIGLAVSTAGDRIYVTQGAATNIGVVLDGGGTVIGPMTPPDTATGHQPIYAAIDPITQEVYEADRLAGTIYVFDRDGAYLRELVPPNTSGWQPVGLAFDGAGALYVTDLSGSGARILVIDRNGTVVRTVGAGDRLNFPNGVAVDKAGVIYVADSNNGRLLAYATDGKVVAQVGRGVGKGSLGIPRGLSIDGDGRLFVTDTTAQEISIFRVLNGAAGQLEYLGSFGVPGIGDGQFTFPTSVAVDSRGHVYVADTFNDRVQLWSY